MKHPEDMILEIQKAKLLHGKAAALAHENWQRIFNYCPNGRLLPAGVNSGGLVAMNYPYLAWASINEGTGYVKLPNV